MTSLKVLLGAVALSVLAIGCGEQNAAPAGPSPELESTKQQLQSVSAERDSLKTEAENAKAQVASLQQQLEAAKSAPAAAAKDEEPAAEKPTAKKEKAVEKKAPKLSEEQKQEVKTKRRSM